MYTETNYPSKAALKRDLAAGKSIRTYSPGPFPGVTDGVANLEGPHSPQAHSWYATATLVDGVVVKVK